MPEILQISQLGNPVLRQPSQVVENVKDDRIQQLIDNLISTVQHAHGVGIAAPQAAMCDRLFIVASRPNLRYPQAPHMEPTAMINPRIVAASTDTAKDWEGCLSQHEYDHLDGIVFLDRVESTTELMTEDEYQQQFVKLL
ncbi:MAG: peptide deformylase [Oscillatoriales cyanobacterium]|nr:MAG: peptide deformylase [Oscillatoriales cyanobacterium]